MVNVINLPGWRKATQYVPHHSMDNPDERMFSENWVYQESLEAHLKQPYMISGVKTATSILAKLVELRILKTG